MLSCEEERAALSHSLAGRGLPIRLHLESCPTITLIIVVFLIVAQAGRRFPFGRALLVLLGTKLNVLLEVFLSFFLTEWLQGHGSHRFLNRKCVFSLL
jgi:hypothetical protein